MGAEGSCGNTSLICLTKYTMVNNPIVTKGPKCILPVITRVKIIILVKIITRKLEKLKMHI